MDVWVGRGLDAVSVCLFEDAMVKDAMRESTQQGAEDGSGAGGCVGDATSGWAMCGGKKWTDEGLAQDGEAGVGRVGMDQGGVGGGDASTKGECETCCHGGDGDASTKKECGTCCQGEDGDTWTKEEWDEWLKGNTPMNLEAAPCAIH